MGPEAGPRRAGRCTLALVVFLRGVNVGGHRTLRPTALAARLRHLGVVNVGAAGTFVVRARVSQGALRAQLRSALPFETEIAICRAEDVLDLVATDPFAGRRRARAQVRFVAVLLRRRPASGVPACLPPSGRWLVHVLGVRGRFVAGVHRREMKALPALGALERGLGVPMTVRSWSTLLAVAAVLEARDGRGL